MWDDARRWWLRWSQALQDKCDEPFELTIAHAAIQEDVRAMERTLGLCLPEELRRFFLEFSSKVFLAWFFREDYALPTHFRYTSGGYLDLDIVDQETWTTNWSSYEERFPGASPNGSQCYDFNDVYPFMQTGSGDTLLIVVRGPKLGSVLFHGCEDLGMQNATLASSLSGFLESWGALGCPGPDALAIAPFYDREQDRLLMTGDAADKWRAFCGVL
jgi:hypothetical protein